MEDPLFGGHGWLENAEVEPPAHGSVFAGVWKTLGVDGVAGVSAGSGDCIGSGSCFLLLPNRILPKKPEEEGLDLCVIVSAEDDAGPLWLLMLDSSSFCRYELDL